MLAGATHRLPRPDTSWPPRAGTARLLRHRPATRYSASPTPRFPPLPCARPRMQCAKSTQSRSLETDRAPPKITEEEPRCAPKQRAVTRLATFGIRPSVLHARGKVHRETAKVPKILRLDRRRSSAYAGPAGEGRGFFTAAPGTTANSVFNSRTRPVL